MKPLKVGFVLDDSLDRPDGVQQYVLTLGTWLARKGHEVHYLVGETKRQDLAHLHSLGRNVSVRFNHNRLSMPLPVSRKLVRELLTTENFDVLHVQMPYSPFLAHRLVQAAPPQTAVVGTFHIAPHSNLVKLGARVLKAWEHTSLKRFDDVLSVSSAAQTFAADALGLTSEIIPNAIELEPFTVAKPLAAYDDGVLNIVFLGRLVARKGCLHLLKAVAKLKLDDLPKLRVIIAGDGSLAPELKRLVSDHGLTKVVTFVGRISEKDKPKYLAGADIAVFPSTGGESFGIVLLEAMAAARGVVLAGDNPGYRTVMGADSTQLFQPTNTSQLVAKLTQYLKDSSARSKARSWQQQHVQQFDIDVVGPRILAVYEQALRRRQAP